MYQAGCAADDSPPLPYQTVYASIALLHLFELVVPPPPAKPDLHPVLNVLGSFTFFALAWTNAVGRQVRDGWGLCGLLEELVAGGSSGGSGGGMEGKPQPPAARPKTDDGDDDGMEKDLVVGREGEVEGGPRRRWVSRGGRSTEKE